MVLAVGGRLMIPLSLLMMKGAKTVKIGDLVKTGDNRLGVIVKVIDDETLRAKLQEADPICLALIRGLAMRISDANEAAENYWRELSVYKSLQD